MGSLGLLSPSGTSAPFWDEEVRRVPTWLGPEPPRVDLPGQITSRVVAGSVT